MGTAPPSTTASSPPAPPALLGAWPRSAQLVTAFLLGLATALLAIHSFGYLRWGSRPTELERDNLPGYQIDLNRAGRAELLQLPGVGENLADRIVLYRQARGGFRSVEELVKVRGIGPATLERLRPWVCVARFEETEEDDDAPAVTVKLTRSAGKTSLSPPATRAGGNKAAKLTTTIDINRASAEELRKLPGIGPKLSQRIIEERRKAPFQSVDDLRRRVPGIGPITLQNLRPYVTVENDRVQVATGE